MKKITKKELEKLTLGDESRQKSPLVYNCKELAINEMLFIDKKEWKEYGYISKPANILSSGAKHSRSLINGMKFKTKTYKEGWVVKKIK